MLPFQALRMRSPVAAAGSGFISAGSMASLSAPGSTSVPLPGGTQTNDILLLFVISPNTSIAAPSGWTEAVTYRGVGTAGGSSAVGLQIFWARVDGSESAPSITYVNNHLAGVVLAYRGLTSSGSPVEAHNGGTNTSSSVTFPTITTLGADRVVLCVNANGTDIATGVMGAVTFAGLTDIVEDYDAGTIAGTGSVLSIARGKRAVAGAIGTGSATVSNQGNAFTTLALIPV